jgi:phosphoribosylglycinamide formyltransferase 2
MLLGSGELSRELVIALQRLGAEVIAVDRRADAPLRGVADQSVAVNMADTDELAATIRWWQPKFVVTATDVVATDALTAAAETGLTEVVPSARSARLTADPEGLRRLVADELGLPTAPFWFAGSLDELRSAVEQAGFPMTVKPVAAPPGEGQSLMVRAEDVEPAWQRAVRAGDDAVGAPPACGGRSDAEERRRSTAGGRVSPTRVMAETVVEFDHEVTLLTVRGDGPAGPVLDFCAPIGHRCIDGPNGQLVLESWQPLTLSTPALDAAKSIAARVVRALGGRGLFGVELKIRGDEVYFSGVTVRPCDTAWVTLRTQRLSGFELQARAILGLAIDTIMISPGAARLVYSGRQAAGAAAAETRPGAVAVLAGALNVAESDVVVFGHHEGYPRRRLGAAVATASDVTTARDRARQVSAALGKLWQR